MNPSIERQKDENLKQFKIRICENKDTYSLNWTQVADIINRESGESVTESVYRKWWKIYSEGYNDAISDNVNSDDVLDKLTEKELKLKKERIKLSSERNEINKWLTIQSRDEMIHDKIVAAINNTKQIDIPKHKITPEQAEFATIVPLADPHFGAEFIVYGLQGEVLNEYSPEIFEKRMWDLFNKIITKVERENIKHIHLSNQGDGVDGLLHTSQLQKLRYGMVDQVINFSNFMTHWINELSKYVYIDYYTVLGNHSENRPWNSQRGEFADENMERIIAWYVKSALSNNQNVTVHEASNIVYKDIIGNKTLFTHGQYEKNLEQSIKDYMLTYNVPVTLMIAGHLHSNHTKTIGMSGGLDIEFVQCPSIVGANNYSVRLKKASKAGAKMLIVEKDAGIATTYDFKLS